MAGPPENQPYAARRWIFRAAGLLLLLLIIGATGVYLAQPKPRQSANQLASETLTTQTAGRALPSSARSRAAVARARKVLRPLLAAKNLRLGQPIYIRIFKESRELELWMKGSRGWTLFKTYPVCRYSGSLGPKLKEGDGQAPEGFYRVAARQLNPNSSYHLSFNLGFPNRWDRGKGRTGSFLMVHGDCVSIGCYAMTDAGIEEIWTLVTAALHGGQPAFQVHAFPFRMESAAMTTHRKHRAFGFWQELKPCYDRFETARVPPRVRVRSGKYVCS